MVNKSLTRRDHRTMFPLSDRFPKFIILQSQTFKKNFQVINADLHKMLYFIMHYCFSGIEFEGANHSPGNVEIFDVKLNTSLDIPNYCHDYSLMRYLMRLVITRAAVRGRNVKFVISLPGRKRINFNSTFTLGLSKREISNIKVQRH